MKKNNPKKRQLAEYGAAPMVLGSFEIKASEMMYVQYMPIFSHELCKDPYFVVPENLKFISTLLRHVRYSPSCDHVYATVKSFFVPGCMPQNRPGWHSDGFGTFDTNYIWYDAIPTEFALQVFDISEDSDEQSLRDMADQVRPESIVTYGAGNLLLLDKGCIHRPALAPGRGCMRTFVKITVSTDRFDMDGNAQNPLLPHDWFMRPRGMERNHTSSNLPAAFLSDAPF